MQKVKFEHKGEEGRERKSKRDGKVGEDRSKFSKSDFSVLDKVGFEPTNPKDEIQNATLPLKTRAIDHSATCLAFCARRLNVATIYAVAIASFSQSFSFRSSNRPERHLDSRACTQNDVDKRSVLLRWIASDLVNEGESVHVCEDSWQRDRERRRYKNVCGAEGMLKCGEERGEMQKKLRCVEEAGQ